MLSVNEFNKVLYFAKFRANSSQSTLVVTNTITGNILGVFFPVSFQRIICQTEPRDFSKASQNTVLCKVKKCKI